MTTRRVTVRLIDLGLDDDLAPFAAFAQGVVAPFAPRATRGLTPPDIELVRTRELASVVAALQQPAHVIHLVARADASADFIGFNRDHERTVLTIEELLLHVAAEGGAIRPTGLIVDAAKSGTRRFVKAVRDVVATPVTFVGAPGDVSWSESTLFAAAFYAAFLEGTGKNAARAADRARNAYRVATGHASPLRGETVNPSRGR